MIDKEKYLKFFQKRYDKYKISFVGIEFDFLYVYAFLDNADYDIMTFTVDCLEDRIRYSLRVEYPKFFYIVFGSLLNIIRFLDLFLLKKCRVEDINKTLNLGIKKGQYIGVWQ